MHHRGVLRLRFVYFLGFRVTGEAGLQLEAGLHAEEFHHFSASIHVVLVFVAEEQVLLIFSEFCVFILALELVHGGDIVAYFLVNVLFDSCAAVRHHRFCLIFAQVEVH